MPYRSARCASCYCSDPDLVFFLNKPLGDEYSYYRRRREDESRYLVARKGDYILAPHHCEKCWFINFYGCCPDWGIL